MNLWHEAKKNKKKTQWCVRAERGMTFARPFCPKVFQRRFPYLWTIHCIHTWALIGARIRSYSSRNFAVNATENSCSSDSASKPRPLHSPSYNKHPNWTTYITAYRFVLKVTTHFFHVSVSLSMWGTSMNVIPKSWMGQNEHAHLRGGNDMTNNCFGIVKYLHCWLNRDLQTVVSYVQWIVHTPTQCRCATKTNITTLVQYHPHITLQVHTVCTIKTHHGSYFICKSSTTIEGIKTCKQNICHAPSF